MEKVTEYQSELFSDMKKLYDEMLINLFEVDKFGPLAKDNFLKKLTLFNKNLEIIKYNIKDLLIDLKMNDCQLSESANSEIEDEMEINNLLNEVSPLVLYYLANRKSNDLF
mgnify:FL=1|tara:strand:+ start:75 stop:407 length:333 start_codon:yes stop_codon:yes gene_type:complete